MIVPAADARIVITTTGSREEAERIARFLVEEQIAACANLLPGITSVYRWEGEVETADEILLVIKTTAGNLASLDAALRRLHSYEVPEMLVLEPEAGSKTYLEWITRSTRPSG